MGCVEEQNFTPPEEIEKGGTGVVKSKAAVRAESFAELLCFQNLKRIRGVVVGLVLAALKEHFGVVEQDGGENDCDQKRRAAPPRSPWSFRRIGICNGGDGRRARWHGKYLSTAPRILPSQPLEKSVDAGGSADCQSDNLREHHDDAKTGGHRDDGAFHSRRVVADGLVPSFESLRAGSDCRLERGDSGSGRLSDALRAGEEEAGFENTVLQGRPRCRGENPEQGDAIRLAFGWTVRLRGREFPGPAAGSL